jgi:two-component system, LytTR family, sensor kinase
LATSLLQTFRFRITFAIVWLSLAEVQAIVLTHYGFSWKIALIDSSISNILLAAVSLLIVTTLQYYIPRKNKYIYIIALVTILSVAWLFISRAVLTIAIDDHSEYDGFFSDSMVLRLVFSLLVIGCMALICVLWYTIQDQQQAENRKTEAEKLSREAELSKLRQQLQPHFLFNSLNSINALIGSEPQQARTMIQQLSDFLRGTLKKEENQWVSLEEELQHLQLYLDIEKVRFGHRLEAIILLDDSAKKTNIPAMLLQPVVENAIKFGLYDTTGPVMINIHAWKESEYLIIKVKNPFDADTSIPNKGTGFGLNSVRRRLDLLFGRRGLLEANTEDNNFVTVIRIPQQI